jgi:acetoin utilization protein AcuC
VLLYHPLFNGRGFSPLQESWMRYPRLLERLGELGLQHRLPVLEPPLATANELALVHPSRYVEWVRSQEQAGGRYFDRSTPAWPGVFDRARAAVGASVLGARLIGQGACAAAFNPSGGLHHAHAERAGGFCIFNDVVIAARVLQREFDYRRIAILDLDGHHGDGTQALLYAEPLLYISLHRYGDRFYPGTGAAEERGEGAGLGHTLNVPLPRHCGDAAFLLALHRIVAPALRCYRPQCLILQYGTDGHYADVMVRLGLTTRAFAESARLVRQVAGDLCQGKLLVVGGGGYRPEDAVRCWLLLLGELADLPAEILEHLHDRPPFPPPATGAMSRVEALIARLLDQAPCPPATQGETATAWI